MQNKYPRIYLDIVDISAKYLSIYPKRRYIHGYIQGGYIFYEYIRNIFLKNIFLWIYRKYHFLDISIVIFDIFENNQKTHIFLKISENKISFCIRYMKSYNRRKLLKIFHGYIRKGYIQNQKKNISK